MTAINPETDIQKLQDNKMATADAIAHVIVRHINEKGKCDRADLIATGFTEAQLNAALPLGRGFAALILEREVSRH